MNISDYNIKKKISRSFEDCRLKSRSHAEKSVSTPALHSLLSIHFSMSIFLTPNIVGGFCGSVFFMQISSAKDLFLKLEDATLLDSSYLTQLFKTIHREDLVRQVQNGSRQAEEADAVPSLSDYR